MSIHDLTPDGGRWILYAPDPLFIPADERRFRRALMRSIMYGFAVLPRDAENEIIEAVPVRELRRPRTALGSGVIAGVHDADCVPFRYSLDTRRP